MLGAGLTMLAVGIWTLPMTQWDGTAFYLAPMTGAVHVSVGKDASTIISHAIAVHVAELLHRSTLSQGSGAMAVIDPAGLVLVAVMVMIDEAVAAVYPTQVILASFLDGDFWWDWLGRSLRSEVQMTEEHLQVSGVLRTGFVVVVLHPLEAFGTAILFNLATV